MIAGNGRGPTLAAFGRRVTLGLALAQAIGAAAAAAQTVTGFVLEENTGIAVAGATVSVAQLGGKVQGGATSDSAGAFLISLGIRTGRYVVSVAHPSYRAFADTLELRMQEAVRLELHIARDAIALQPVVVTARMKRRLEGYYDRQQRGTGFGRFLPRTHLDRIPANRTTDYLRRIPGVQLEHTDTGNIIVIRNGLGECAPVIYIDGMPVEQHGDDVDDALQPDMIEGIEMYPGTAGMPMEFAAAQATGCGVVAFWTRDATGQSLVWARVVISALGIAAFVFTSMKVML